MVSSVSPCFRSKICKCMLVFSKHITLFNNSTIYKIIALYVLNIFIMNLISNYDLYNSPNIRIDYDYDIKNK